MSIYMGSLLSFKALHAFTDALDLNGDLDNPFPVVRSWMEPDQVAWLRYLLAAMDDAPSVFTHGKWALIQQLDTMLDAEARLYPARTVHLAGKVIEESGKP